MVVFNSRTSFKNNFFLYWYSLFDVTLTLHLYFLINSFTNSFNVIIVATLEPFVGLEPLVDGCCNLNPVSSHSRWGFLLPAFLNVKDNVCSVFPAFFLVHVL